MNDGRQKQTWLSALAEAAKEQGFELPTYDVYGMGSLRSVTTLGNRFVTLKRLLRRGKSEFDGVEWALWQQLDEQPLLVACFRDALEPKHESVELTLKLVKGWLVDEWSADETRRAVAGNPGTQSVQPPPVGVAVAH